MQQGKNSWREWVRYHCETPPCKSLCVCISMCVVASPCVCLHPLSPVTCGTEAPILALRASPHHASCVTACHLLCVMRGCLLTRVLCPSGLMAFLKHTHIMTLSVYPAVELPQVHKEPRKLLTSVIESQISISCTFHKLSQNYLSVGLLKYLALSCRWFCIRHSSKSSTTFSSCSPFEHPTKAELVLYHSLVNFSLVYRIQLVWSLECTTLRKKGGEGGWEDGRLGSSLTIALPLISLHGCGRRRS